VLGSSPAVASGMGATNLLLSSEVEVRVLKGDLAPLHCFEITVLLLSSFD
jgi:hypothetical protein